MSQAMALKIKGRFTHPNDLSEVPEGALAIARNVNIDRESIATPRRGVDRQAYDFGSTSDRANKIFEYRGSRIIHYGSTLARDTGSAYSSYAGTISAPDGSTPVRAVEASQNFYFSTSTGVRKLDSPTGTIRDSGAPKGTYVTGATTGSSGFLSHTNSVAYRMLWGYEDANGNLILGAPSQRAVVSNTGGGSRDVKLTFGIPDGVDTNWIFQVYRSPQGTPTEPTDEMFLVYEKNPTSGSFATFSKTFLDAAVNTSSETITSTAHGFANGDSVIFSNSGGALPGGITAGTIYFVVGSTANTFQVSTTLAGSALNITSASGGGTHTVRGAGRISFRDLTDDSLAGATLYTSPSQQTITGANDRPPFAKDLAVFKGCVFYANLRYPHRLALTLIAVPEVDDVLTLNGVAYTFKASTSVSANQVQRFTSGSVSQNIANTAIELCSVINQSASNTGANAVYAYYMSAANETPGKILVESRTAGGALFSATWTPVASSAPWQPVLPGSGTIVSSSNDTFGNGIAFSKPGQPEAVPLVNVLRVGSADQEILRVKALRDSLFIIKADGVYRITGEDAGSFRVELFDGTAKVIGPETVSELNNAIYMLSDQGVVSCSETGISVVSRPIETDLLELIGTNLAGLRSYAFGIGYESERKYILAVPAADADTSAKIFHVYNTFTNAWTTWDGLGSRCADISGSDLLVLASDASNRLLIERKAQADSDHADWIAAATISSVTGGGLTLSMTNTDLLTEGDVVWQSNSNYSVVKSASGATGTATLYFKGNLTTGDATIFRGIDAEIEWVPKTGQNPGAAKHFQEVAMLFKKGFRLFSTLSFYSDESGSLESVRIDGPGFGNWGFFTWGGTTWGGVIGRAPKRTLVPLEKARATQLSIRFNYRVAFAAFELTGLSVLYNLISTRFGR
jgi:hypothetical protein